MFLSTLKIILFLLILRFSVKSLITYYYYFEAVLLPVFFLVIIWGYQPERFLASLYMFFYTLTASLPLLLAISYMSLERGSRDLNCLPLNNYNVRSLIIIILRTAFLVKFPAYLVHLWLPKAHVEAPVSGSIILAGVLLKLGGYGLFLVMSILNLSYCFINLVVVLSMLGGGFIAVLILRVPDLKVAIAYSSVVHMRIVITTLIRVRVVGFIGAVIIILVHGLTSSGIFRAVNIIYERSHSRSLILNKGLLSYSPLFTLFWFLLTILNFAGPFTINLLSEIIIIQRILVYSWVIVIPIRFLCFFSAAYNLNIYASSQQGLRIKTLEGYGSNRIREALILFRHIWPCMLLLLIV